MLLKDFGMTKEQLVETAEKYMNETFKRYDFACDSSKDEYLYGEDGTEYLDFLGGIAVNSVGGCNQAVIDAFNKGTISRIYAVGMITEGMNLAEIEAGIIIQLDGKERLFIQKVGRALRAKSPIVCIFYYKNTQDETYLRKALENVDEKYIKHVTIEQLKTMKL